jgi:hypothetical protein
MEELERKKATAIDALLDQRDAINEQLERLGYRKMAPVPPTPTYHRPAPTGTNERRSRNADPNRACKVCGETGHDARRHRYEKNNDGQVATRAPVVGDAP